MVLLPGLADSRKSETGEKKTGEITKKKEILNEEGNIIIIKMIAPVKFGDKKGKQWRTNKRDDTNKGKIRIEKDKKGKIKTH